MTQSSEHVSWWLVLVPSMITTALSFCGMWAIIRKRSWRDWRPLGKAVAAPAHLVDREPRRVKDMIPGDAAYVGAWNIVTSGKSHKVFVPWNALLAETPKNPHDAFAPLQIKRLEQGFSLAVRQSDKFRTSPLPWGYYAPVTEIIQAETLSG